MRSVTQQASKLSAALVASACVELPEPPPLPANLVARYEAYERPSGTLAEPQVRAVIARAEQLPALSKQLNGLSFVRNMLSDASAALHDNTGSLKDIEVKGRVQAFTACPGETASPPFSADKNGSIDVVLGVSASRIRRGLDGHAQNCRFVTESAGGRTRITLNAELIADLGADLAIGSPLPGALLISGRNVSTTTESPGGTLDIAFEDYEFRVTEAGAIEVSAELRELDVAQPGTVVGISHLDGSFSVREQRGEWRCRDEVSPCTLAR